MANGKSQGDIRTIEKIYEIVKYEFDYVLEVDSGHSQRAATIFSFGGVILSIAFYLYLSGRLFMPLFTIGIALISASLLLSFFAIKSWKVRGAPTPRVLGTKYITQNYEDVLKQIISSLIASFEYNKAKTGRRGFIVDCGFCCVLIGLFFLALSALVN